VTNKALERAVVLPLKTPSTVKSGDMLVFGGVEAPAAVGDQNALIFGIATQDATDAFSNVQPFIGVDREGAFNLPVQGEFGCPLVLHALKPGDPVYADIFGAGSTYDATTNCWTGFKLNGNTGGVWVGNVLDPVPAGAGTTTVRVALRT
jgi:hypothetical protein